MTLQWITEHATTSTFTVPAPRGESAPGALLDVRVSYHPGNGAVVRVLGEVDMLGAPRLKELLDCRLRSALTDVVLDLDEVSFMSVAGVHVLEHTARYAQCNGKNLLIDIGDSQATRRVLRATGLLNQLPLPAPERLHREDVFDDTGILATGEDSWER